MNVIADGKFQWESKAVIKYSWWLWNNTDKKSQNGNLIIDSHLSVTSFEKINSLSCLS